MIDLHTHSTISDGVYTPSELVEKAIESGLSVLCITDHNAVNENIFELREKYKCIELPVGCEFSCGYETKNSRMVQLHIGGIGFDIHDKEIRRIIEYNRASMEPYIKKVLSKLDSECGIKLCSYEELLSRYKESQTVGRKHIALEMVRQGICVDPDEAFDRFIGKGQPAFVSNAIYFATMQEVVRAIVNSGGVASLCHPFQYSLCEDEFRALLSEFSELTKGRGAMEVYYSAYDREQQLYLKKLACEYKLLESAASDYHGDGKIKELGCYPDHIYVAMKSILDKK